MKVMRVFTGKGISSRLRVVMNACDARTQEVEAEA